MHPTFCGRIFREVVGTGTRTQYNTDFKLVGIWWPQFIFLLRERKQSRLPYCDQPAYGFGYGFSANFSANLILIKIKDIRTDKQLSFSLVTWNFQWLMMAYGLTLWGLEQGLILHQCLPQTSNNSLCQSLLAYLCLLILYIKFPSLQLRMKWSQF